MQKEAEEIAGTLPSLRGETHLDDDVELAAKSRRGRGSYRNSPIWKLAHAREILGPDKIIGVTAKNRGTGESRRSGRR